MPTSYLGPGGQPLTLPPDWGGWNSGQQQSWLYQNGGYPAGGTPPAAPTVPTPLDANGNPISYPGGTSVTGQSVTPAGVAPPPGATPPAATPPPASSGDGGGGGGGGSNIPPLGPPSPFGAPFPTLPSTPVFTPPSYTPPPAFQAPSVAQAMAAPGYQFQEQQGLTDLQNWAAAKGTLNDSDTGQALEQFGQQSAQSDYANVYNQALQGYNTNYQTQYTDPYAIAFQGAQAAFAPQMTGYTTQANQGQANWQDAYNLWLSQNQLTQGTQGLAIQAG
jgi:hypothetical protein